MKRILALDIGDRRIGVAMSDTLGILATPLTIVERTKLENDIAAVIELIRKNDVGRIVAGLPQTTGGGIGHQAEKVQAFVAALTGQTDVPVVFRDESFTSLTARQLMRESEKNKRSKIKDKKVRDDAAAAAVLLQGYLEEAGRQ